jgi:hypothetical protein
MKRRFGYPPMSVACRSCSKARLFSAASTLKSRMIALQSRHFRKRTPDLHNSARFNTIPALRAIKMTPVLKKISRSSPSWIGLRLSPRTSPTKASNCSGTMATTAMCRREKEKSKSPKRKPRFARSAGIQGIKKR